ASRELLDEAQFLRTDLPQNQPLLQTAVPVPLQPGDVLFFHARCFHAAGEQHCRVNEHSNSAAAYRGIACL
ncbi:MAG: phytanoyl-CoA dioxygenase family protein, partial [Planctomyces sp.]